jgi:hypothetical protein
MYCLKELNKSIEYYKLSYSSHHVLYTSSYSYLANKEYRTGFALYENRLHTNIAEDGQKND